MTAKEKAIELYNKFWDAYQHDPVAHECALICVDEKIETLLPYAGLLDIKKTIDELEEVKQELNKL